MVAPSNQAQRRQGAQGGLSEGCLGGILFFKKNKIVRAQGGPIVGEISYLPLAMVARHRATIVSGSSRPGGYGLRGLNAPLLYGLRALTASARRLATSARERTASQEHPVPRTAPLGLPGAERSGNGRKSGGAPPPTPGVRTPHMGQGHRCPNGSTSAHTNHNYL